MPVTTEAPAAMEMREMEAVLEQEVTTMLAAVRAAAAAAEQEADEILARKQNVQRKNYKRQAVAKA